MTEQKRRDPHAAAEYIIQNAPKFGAAKADRLYLEEFRKTQKALLMHESPAKTVSERETYAYAAPQYLDVLDRYKAAILEEETLRLKIKGAELVIELYRTESASNRNQDRAMR